jgi:hypothetical protein
MKTWATRVRASHGLDVDSIAVVRAKTVCPGK